MKSICLAAMACCIVACVAFVPSASAKGLAVAVLDTPFKGSLLYIPNDGRTHPGVVVLHGSEGGSDEGYHVQAAELAASGFAALALCYFDCNRYLTELRATLGDVDAKQVNDAIAWLRASDYVKGKRVALYGFSRGAELASSVAATAEPGPGMPDALALHAATDVYTGQSNWDWFDSRCWSCGGKTCTFRDPVEKRTWSNTCGPKPVDEKFQLYGLNKSAWKLGSGPSDTGKPIPLENYAGPIFITHGTSDNVWSYKKSQRLRDRLVAAGKTNVTLVTFDGEDHSFSPKAETSRMQQLVDFLNRTVGRR